ncbi:hypothetical protein P148_SR1C00001G1018 [candidate division SR1 bacterium RAAC1_SR1_1]|nr:hypothetical protein P148_SR1C00001G1018 [candidate division SR1 bacterium RAAC1_SR1_1]
MTDAMFRYGGGGNPRPLTKKEIEKMKKIMKKVPIIKARNDIYHEQEEKKADNEFENRLKELEQ